MSYLDPFRDVLIKAIAPSPIPRNVRVRITCHMVACVEVIPVVDTFKNIGTATCPTNIARTTRATPTSSILSPNPAMIIIPALLFKEDCYTYKNRHTYYDQQI